MWRKSLVGLIACTGLVHLATLSSDVELLHWIFKLLPMALIIALAVGSRSDGGEGAKYRNLIVTGLLFSIGGDTFLLLPDDPWFVFGLGSFLIGHLSYVAAMFVRWLGSGRIQGNGGRDRVPAIRTRNAWMAGLSAGILIVAYSVLLGSRFHASIMADDSQSGLWVPVVVYIAVIGAMGWSAIMSRNAYATCWALLFMASDSILAWNKFVSDVPWSGVLIMATYFSAQFLIASSIAGGKGRSLRRAPIVNGGLEG
ncbi:lysoplasmalogenase [Paenibacillus sp. LHD-117]|uniref:lysoplasmalogenase n=1 Tax=Paenibacillus sp. LHD-117 TaxID=3071412 RepID=UPI0027DF54D8|nr:lysoplasmalogenase [Paenibacillus sp. LHD-117]MDQ6418867.1 lysoplasmalogenase [Paenibacillus sp. LHD-117]